MKNWFKKQFAAEPKNPDETGIPIYSLNWFIHVLIKNVGQVKWIRMTPAEQEKHDKEKPYNAGYPYKVITLPIPEGKDIVLKDDGKIKIHCDSERTRNFIIEMARSYDQLEKLYHYSIHDRKSDPWLEADKLGPIPMFSSFRGPRTFLVFSPTLCYVNGGINFGMEYEGKWYIFLNGQKVEHKVTHYKHLPPRPLMELPEYETVKEEAERLRKILVETHEKQR